MNELHVYTESLGSGGGQVGRREADKATDVQQEGCQDLTLQQCSFVPQGYRCLE